MSEHRWYAIQTTAGHENKVRSLVERRIKDDLRPAEEKPIRQALVPIQDRKIYPGYVLVEMILNQETIHVINGIQGVIKFVGTGRLPMPLRADEVNRLLGIEEASKDEEPAELAEVGFAGEGMLPPQAAAIRAVATIRAVGNRIALLPLC